MMSMVMMMMPMQTQVHMTSPRYTPKVLEEMELRFDKQRKARQRQMYS